MKTFRILVLLPVLWAGGAHAGWTLANDDSSLNFVTTKANAAAEVGTFGTLDGTVDSAGNVTISIDLNSVDTAIELRNERMREMLFETDRFPSATVAAKIDIAAVEALTVGSGTNLVTEAALRINDIALSLTVELEVVRLSESRVLVAASKPLIVNAGQVGLLDGVERLREIAGLPSISPAVPVTFLFAFDKD